MTDTDRRVPSPRLAALMERAKPAFERSRRVIEEARQIRAMADASRSSGSAHGMPAEIGTDPLDNRPCA